MRTSPWPADTTFTAGAHAMMARQRIDRALLDATQPTKADGPVGRRIGIDNHPMARQGTRQYSGGGSRTRRFRQSFLISYAHRIGNASTTPRNRPASPPPRPDAPICSPSSPPAARPSTRPPRR